MADSLDEEATIRAFIVPTKRNRYVAALANSKKRATFLDCLNHCRDIDERFATALPSAVDAPTILRSHGAPETGHVISDCREIDGQVMSLADAIDQAEYIGFGTIISCIPGRLAYYLDEAGSKRRLLLTRNDSNR